MSFGSSYSRTPSGCRPRGGVGTRAPPDGERGQSSSSSGELQRLTNHVLALQVFLGECAIRGKREFDSLAQVGASFSQARALRIRAGQLLDESDVALRHLLEDCGEL